MKKDHKWTNWRAEGSTEKRTLRVFWAVVPLAPGRTEPVSLAHENVRRGHYYTSREAPPATPYRDALEPSCN